MGGDTVMCLVICSWFFLFTGASGLVAARKRRSVGGWVTLGLLFGLFAFVVLLLLPTLPEVDPARPHRYLLGIACDGPVYRTAAIARDRDRLRGSVLQGLDWTAHRIWARERLRDPDAALLRLYDRLQLERIARIRLTAGYGGDAALLRLFDRLQQQGAPPVTPPPAARGPVCARCGGPPSATARCCDPCGAPARVPTSPATPVATATSRGPTVAQVISPTASAGPSPQTRTTGPLAVGTVLSGRYRISEQLGAGAFGRVYRAEDILDATSPPLAIKELLDDQFKALADKQEVVRRFRREVSTLLRLEHPSIPKVHAYWTETVTDGPFYLAMDFIPGRTLEQMLADKGQIDWRQAAEWGMSICKALAYLHGRTPPFLFRDLKPANIMIEAATNAPKLIDFGIARQFTARAGQTLLGTPGYAPIEQWMGRTEPRSDLYAVGAVLHALVSGRAPSAELSRLQAGGLDVPQAMKQLFPPLDTLVAGLPPAVVHTVDRAVAYDVVDRYPDVMALGVALAEALVTSTARAVAALQP